MPTTLTALRGQMFVVLFLPVSCLYAGQHAAESQDKVPVIADEPAAIDPATLVSDTLARKMNVEFTQAALSEVASWIRENANTPVLFDKPALEDANLSLSEPVSDHLDNDSLYLLLNRLHTLGLSWYLQDNIVHITTVEAAERRMVTIPYTVGYFLDSDIKASRLIDVIIASLGGLWTDLDGEGGSIKLLGDVLFVRQTDELHLRLRGLLAALRKHSRQTYISAPPQHKLLRARLEENVTVSFDDDPLIEAVQQLSQQCGIDIRIDAQQLRNERIRERQPVSLDLGDRQLQTVLEVLLTELNLTWMLRDGVLWITSQDRASVESVTAVYDVRDLCRDEDESMALTDAIQSQTGASWIDVDGDGGTIIFARPGTMVIRHTDREHGRVLRLLNAYRTALKASKPRQRIHDLDDDILTRYYSMQQPVAENLHKFFLRNVEPTSWKTADSRDAFGVIEALLPAGKSVVGRDASSKSRATRSEFITENSVLVITQSRANHREIAKIIRRIQHGDERPIDLEGGASGGGGGGGFGAGFFSLKPIVQRDSP